MKKNMGGLDRGIRIVAGLIIAALYYYQVIDGVLGNVLLALAAIFLITSFVSVCPIYALFGINTCKVEK